MDVLRDDPVAGFYRWLATNYGGVSFTKYKYMVPNSPIVEIDPHAPMSQSTILTYVKWVRTYLQRAKNPLSNKEANKFLRKHPNPSARRALSLYFQYISETTTDPKLVGLMLELDDATRRVFQRFSKGLPGSGRRHELISDENPWKVWAEVIDAFPMEGIPKDVAKSINLAGNKYFTRPWFWRHVKAIACLQLLWGLRAGDAIRLKKYEVKRSKSGAILKIWVIQKGWRESKEKMPISTADLKSTPHEWLLPYFEYLVEYLRARGKVRFPFLHITNEDTPGSKSLSYSTVYAAYYSAVRWTAEQRFGKKQGTHDIRRAVITQLLDEGKTPPLVQQWVGHAKVEQTMKYYRRKATAKAIFK